MVRSRDFLFGGCGEGHSGCKMSNLGYAAGLYSIGVFVFLFFSLGVLSCRAGLGNA